jgi:hypothetical protein
VRFSLYSFVVVTCSVLATPRAAFAQPPTDARADHERPHVQVSRDELRIVFPRDTAHRWGWSAAPPEPANAPRYSWRMEVDAIQGLRDLRFDVRSSIPFPSAFRDLRDLLGTGHGFICRYEMSSMCRETRMRGTAEDGHPVLSLRDGTLISWLFALRPGFVRLTNDRPETAFVWDSVRIEYVAPGVRALDSATRAAALRARRHESLEHFSVQRGIMGGRGLTNRIWLIVGDSLPLLLFETQRLEDLRAPGQRDLSDSGWVVLDPRVAQLIEPASGVAPGREPRSRKEYVVVEYGPPRMYAKALRPGTTTIRVRGVHGQLDAALDSDFPPGVIESDLIVTRAPRRLRITPRPDTVRVGQSLPLRVLLYDATGESTDRIPVQLGCTGCSGSFYDGVRPAHIRPDTPGRMTIVASLDGLADTLSIIVADSIPR